jgi:hypothetical protein
MAHTRSPFWSMVNGSAPAVSAVLLVGIIAMNFSFGMFTPRNIPLADGYHERVRDSIEAFPYRIGDWIGSDMPVQEAAQRLLRPNKLFQRGYTNPETGHMVMLLVVHCKDTRDMVGHFPPNCYPANGWVQLDERAEFLTWSGQEHPAVRYTFARGTLGQKREMSILNFFVLPDAELPVVATMSEVNRAAQASARAGLGAGQIQIMADLSMPEDEREQAVAEFVRALDPVIGAIASGVSDE